MLKIHVLHYGSREGFPETSEDSMELKGTSISENDEAYSAFSNYQPKFKGKFSIDEK